MKRALLFFAAVLLPAAFAVAQEVEITSEPSHHLALQNEYVRVFKVEVASQAATLMHRHRHDYLFVTLGDSRISNEVQGKAPLELKHADGECEFARGNFAHVARNLSDQPFRNVTIELMQDEKFRNAPSPWPMEGGDQEFPGGRLKVLFVRAGARVSEIDLQPGAAVPKRHYGPRLLIAVTHLKTRENAEQQRGTLVDIKSGDIKWLPGEKNTTVANAGKLPARLVMVEFR